MIAPLIFIAWLAIVLVVAEDQGLIAGLCVATLLVGSAFAAWAGIKYLCTVI